MFKPILVCYSSDTANVTVVDDRLTNKLTKSYTVWSRMCICRCRCSIGVCLHDEYVYVDDMDIDVVYV